MQAYEAARTRSLNELDKLAGAQNIEQAYNHTRTLHSDHPDWVSHSAYHHAEVERRSAWYDYTKAFCAHILHIEALEKARQHKVLIYAEAFNAPLHLIEQMI